MNKFNENDLLKDLKMGVNYEKDEDGSNIFVVENKDVYVLLIEAYNNTLWLMDFYNYSKIKGKARCTLYFMLKQIIEEFPNININTKIDIPMIEPNTIKNAVMYKKMGFNIKKGSRYISVEPLQTIGQLIKNLERWCNDIEQEPFSKRRRLEWGKYNNKFIKTSYSLKVTQLAKKYRIKLDKNVVKNIKRLLIIHKKAKKYNIRLTKTTSTGKRIYKTEKELLRELKQKLKQKFKKY